MQTANQSEKWSGDVRRSVAHPTAPLAPSVPPARLETLADGVFAIAMTLLVFDLKAPDPATIHGSADLYGYVWSMGWRIVTFAMSFLVMGVYWVGHHYFFFQVKRVDRVFLWLNIGFLLLIALLPFTTALLGQFFEMQAAIVVYAVHLMLIGIMFTATILYGTKNRRLTAADFDEKIARSAIRRVVIAPAFSLVAILVSFVSPRAAFALFPLLLIPAILPGTVDRLMRSQR